ncbi:MAG TPA: PQQ-dependent sugar dehydrogenase [Kofleriaceae bacterium]|nr:PQQ-dependent sugar dehydrogenase [Kofleriaceae bacterium]
MRQTALAVLLLAAACGDDSGARSDANTHGDVPIDMPAIDAPAVPACNPVNGTTVSLRQITQINGEGGALLVTSPPNDGRLFVVMQSGKVMIVENEQVRPTPFLDITGSNISAANPPNEVGLLGLAFHPNYAGTRELYVMYTTSNADVVARFHADPNDPYKVESNTAEIVLSIPDFASNHNGGMLEFGKDGYLYIGTGDGGSGGDPRRNSQTLLRTACTVTGCEPLLGKILRIDVSGMAGAKNYKIPTDNPYADGVAGEPEIYARGLRNPWRWAFDKQTGDMWIGDVGQSGTTGRTTLGYEEIDFVPDGTLKDKNFGWSNWEGGVNVTNPTTDSHCYCSNPGTNTNCNYPTCATAGFTFPQVERDHANDGFLAIIGGDVYRGTCYPDLIGTYFFGDNSKRQLSKATVSGTTVTATDLPAPASNWPAGIASIHKAAGGELFLTTATQTTTANGRIYHIEAGP